MVGPFPRKSEGDPPMLRLFLRIRMCGFGSIRIDDVGLCQVAPAAEQNASPMLEDAALGGTELLCGDALIRKPRLSHTVPSPASSQSKIAAVLSNSGLRDQPGLTPLDPTFCEVS